MERPLPTRYQSLPSSISMKYRMNEENLWIAWTHNFPDRRPKVLTGFVLASPGAQGIEEMKKIEEKGFICGLSLAQLRILVLELQKAIPTFKSKMPTWLGGIEKYLVVESIGIESDQKVKTTLVEASGIEECFTQISSQNPTANILWITPVAPILELKEKMEKILMDENYKLVDFDRRPDVPQEGHPWDWFFAMKNPESYVGYKKAMDYFEANPGSWERARQDLLENP